MKKIIIAVVLIFIVGYFVWQNSAAVAVVDTKFSHNDINKLYNVEQQLAKIIGDSVVNNKTDVLYNLVLTSLQKQILSNNNVKIARNDAIKLVETDNNLKGFYAQAKQKLGEDKYYQLLIEPVVISKLFYNFYNIANDANIQANRVLQALQNTSLEEIAKNNNLTLSELNLAKENNRNLAKQLGDKTGIYPQVFNLGDKVLVLKVIGYDDEFIKTKALAFSKESYKNFITKQLDKDKIVFPFYSLYNMDDIVNKKGSLFNEN
jgi:hypothetical protein